MKKDEIFEKDDILDLNFFQNLILIYVGIHRIWTSLASHPPTHPRADADLHHH